MEFFVSRYAKTLEGLASGQLPERRNPSNWTSWVSSAQPAASVNWGGADGWYRREKENSRYVTTERKKGMSYWRAATLGKLGILGCVTQCLRKQAMWSWQLGFTERGERSGAATGTCYSYCSWQ